MATQKQMAGGQRRSLKAIQRKLEAMAAEWGDVDAYNESALQQLAPKSRRNGRKPCAGRLRGKRRCPPKHL